MFVARSDFGKHAIRAVYPNYTEELKSGEKLAEQTVNSYQTDRYKLDCVNKQ